MESLCFLGKHLLVQKACVEILAKSSRWTCANFGKVQKWTCTNFGKVQGLKSTWIQYRESLDLADFRQVRGLSMGFQARRGMSMRFQGGAA